MERKVNEKREQLKALSKGLGQLKKIGAIDSINDGLIEIYTDNENHIFKSYRQWKEEGKQVKKGEKAFLLWGKPKAIGKNIEAEINTTEDKENEFFPIAYVFSNKQVEKKAEVQNA